MEKNNHEEQWNSLRIKDSLQITPKQTQVIRFLYVLKLKL